MHSNTRLKAEWFMHLRQKNLSDSTLRSYRKNLKTFDRYIKDKSYLEIELEDFQDFFGSLEIAESTKNVLISILMSYYSFLYERGHAAENKRKYMPKVKTTRGPKENVPTINEVKRLVLSADVNDKRGYRDRSMMIVQYSGGLRCAELLSMDLEDVDVIRQTITITRKGGQVQEVPIGSVAM